MDEEDRYTRITLRIPKDLHRSLTEAADQTSKSLNAEIVGRLADSFKGAIEPRALSLEERLERQAKAAHMKVLLIGLESQIRDAAHRVARQQKEISRIRHRAENLDDATNPRIVDAIWSELRDEEKWLVELDAEHKTLVAELNRMKDEVKQMDLFL